MISYKMMALAAAITIRLFLFPIFSVRSTQIMIDNPSPRFHIFICFRGGDTRYNFVSFVYNYLYREGFNVFKDDESLRTGQNISSGILEAINNSMGAVVIFSKNFADSEWCLDELLLIIEQKRKLGPDYVFIPIYVDEVDPDDVAEQVGSYGKALAKHRNRYPKWKFWNRSQKRKQWDNKVKLWTDALTEVAAYKGKRLSGDGAKFIDEVVEEIRQEFILQGITVTPRSNPNDAGMMDKVINKLATIATFVYEKLEAAGRLVTIATFVHVIWEPGGRYLRGCLHHMFRRIHAPTRNKLGDAR